MLPHLAQPQPRGTKQALQDAVEKAVAHDPQMQARAVRVMSSIGSATERSGFLGFGEKRLRRGQG